VLTSVDFAAVAIDGLLCMLEYLPTGGCILAVANRQVASMLHVICNGPETQMGQKRG